MSFLLLEVNTSLLGASKCALCDCWEDQSVERNSHASLRVHVEI